MSQVIPKTVPEYESDKLVIDNHRKFTLLGDKNGRFITEVKKQFQMDRMNWIDGYEYELETYRVELDETAPLIETCKENIRKTKNMCYYLELCENIEIGEEKDHISMPITDENDNDGGFFILFGYKEVEE